MAGRVGNTRGRARHELTTELITREFKYCNLSQSPHLLQINVINESAHDVKISPSVVCYAMTQSHGNDFQCL